MKRLTRPARERTSNSLNFCSTPKHGSGLHGAAGELRGLTSQCLSDRRIGALSVLHTAIAAWSDKDEQQTTRCRLAISYRKRPGEN